VADFCEHDTGHSRSGKGGESHYYISGDWLVKTLLDGVKNPITAVNWMGQILFARGKIQNDGKLHAMYI
jgi:hypothetical protein